MGLLFWFRAVGVLGGLASLAGLVLWWRAWRRDDLRWRANGCTLAFFGGIVVVGAAILGPVFMSAQSAASQATCSTNVKKIATAMIEYASDHDERFPITGIEAVSSRVESPDVFHCPHENSSFGYAMNEHDSGTRQDRIDNPTTLVLIFEADAPNLRFLGDAKDLPRTPRHLDRDYYGFADGHAGGCRRGGTIYLYARASTLDWEPVLTRN